LPYDILRQMAVRLKQMAVRLKIVQEQPSK
jgi:hypothetical protein